MQEWMSTHEEELRHRREIRGHYGVRSFFALLVLCGVALELSHWSSLVPENALIQGSMLLTLGYYLTAVTARGALFSPRNHWAGQLICGFVSASALFMGFVVGMLVSALRQTLELADLLVLSVEVFAVLLAWGCALWANAVQQRQQQPEPPAEEPMLP